jgi:hypothetical protein
MEWVASTLHYLGTWCIQHYYRDAHTSAASSRTDAPADFNGLVRFAERQNLVSARVPSHFKRSLQKRTPPPLPNGIQTPERPARNVVAIPTRLSRLSLRFCEEFTTQVVQITCVLNPSEFPGVFMLVTIGRSAPPSPPAN